MPVADALEQDGLVPARDAQRAAVPGAPLEQVARVGVCALILAAPFEVLRPVLHVPGQSLTSVECVLAGVLVACAVAVGVDRTSAGRTSIAPRLSSLAGWFLVALVALASALAADAFTGNAVHMAARFSVLAVVCLVAQTGAASPQGLVQILRVVVVSGAVVAAVVIADFAGLAAVESVLTWFRSGVAVVGAQVRATGPFQYPTIGSMYLEVAFAIGTGLLLQVRGAGARVALVAALALISEGIVLTFTRAGLITMILSIGIVALMRWTHGVRGSKVALLVAVAGIIGAQVWMSRSAEMLMLRLTTEGQGRWFSADIAAPASIALDTSRPIEVPLTVTNTGRATWDSNASEPVRLSYHWTGLESDDVVAWEGYRTSFLAPVGPGQTVSILARVGSPGRPGRFRLMWDLEQEHRLWFSTEPGARLEFTTGTVTGAPTFRPRTDRGPRQIPIAQVRPGRIELWAAAWRMFTANPLLGVGPDNYRLLYGHYSSIAPADPRVHSNNMYLEVLAGMGALGLAVLLWALLASLRQSWAAAAASDAGAGVAAAVAAIAVHGLVDSFLSFTSTYLLIAVTLGLAAAASRCRDGHAHRV